MAASSAGSKPVLPPDAQEFFLRPKNPTGSFTYKPNVIGVGKLKAKYAPRLQILTEQLRRAGERVEREKAQAGQQKLNTVLSVGATLLGAFLGRSIAGIGNIGRTATAMRNVGKIGKEAADVHRASESVEAARERLTELQSQFDREIATLQADADPALLDIQKNRIRPRKSDISVGTVGLCWIPWRQVADGTSELA